MKGTTEFQKWAPDKREREQAHRHKICANWPYIYSILVVHDAS